MKTVLTHPTTLKGLLLLTLIANLSYGSETLKAAIANQTNMSSEASRDPADASTSTATVADATTPDTAVAAVAPTTPATADAATADPAVGFGTNAPLTKDQLAKAAALRKKEPKRTARSPQTPKSDGLQDLQAKTQGPKPVAATTTATTPTATVKDKAAIVTPAADDKTAPAADAAAPAPAAPVPKAAVKTTTTAANTAPVFKPGAAKPAPPKDDKSKLAAETCVDCERQQQIDKIAQKMAVFSSDLYAKSPEQLDNWVKCSNGDKHSCDVYGAYAAGQTAPGDVAPGAPVVPVAPPISTTPVFSMEAAVADFLKLVNLTHNMHLDDATRQQLTARLNDSFTQLHSKIMDYYASGDAGQRSNAARAITKMTDALPSVMLGADFNARSKINDLTSIKDGFALKDYADKMQARVDQAGTEVQIEKTRADLDQQNCQQSQQFGQQDMAACMNARQEQADLIMKRQQLLQVQSQFQNGAIGPLARISIRRSDINDADFAAYTASYSSVQQELTCMMNSNCNQGAGAAQPSIFTAQNGGVNAGSFNTGVSGLNTSLPGVTPIQATPFTGVNTGVNSGVNPGFIVNGGTNLNSGQMNLSPQATSSVFGACQASPVYNGYMPARPTCLASTNYSLGNTSLFGNGMMMSQGNPNSMQYSTNGVFRRY